MDRYGSYFFSGKSLSKLISIILSFDISVPVVSLSISELSRCAWDSLEVFLLSFPPKQETAPGAVIAIQTFGDFLLLRKGKIREEVVKFIMSWRHSLSACTAQAGGFNVHCGPRIQPDDEEAMENLARYVVRASFSQESQPWRDTFAYCRLGRCIIETLTFQVLRIGDRSGPGDDLHHGRSQGRLPI